MHARGLHRQINGRIPLTSQINPGGTANDANLETSVRAPKSHRSVARRRAADSSRRRRCAIFSSRSLSLIELTSLPRAAGCDSLWVLPLAVVISTAAAMMENAELRTTSTLLRNASTFGSRAQASVN
jgi:hypothetical protein